MKEHCQTVAVLGASYKKERYSNKAIRMLIEYGHRVIPIHPLQKEIEGLPVVKELNQLKEHIDTLTIYVGPSRIQPIIPSIIKMNPGRVILNPGTESEGLESALLKHKIPFLKGCTLVMLQTNQF